MHTSPLGTASSSARSRRALEPTSTGPREPLRSAARSLRPTLLLLCLSASTATTGCDGGTSPSTTSPAPIVQMLLRAGEPMHTARIEYAMSPDSALDFERRPRPLAAGRVALALHGRDGAGTPLVRDPLAPQHYHAALPVAPGQEYRLSGEVDGAAVSGVVRVPGVVRIEEPAGDTIRLTGAELHELPYRWRAEGASAYRLRLAFRRPGGEERQEFLVRDTVGRQRVFSSRVPDTAVATVTAYDANAAAFLFPDTPAGSLDGVFGMLGAATPGERSFVVIWEP